MTRKSNRWKILKVGDMTHSKLRKLSRELSAIEQKDVSMGSLVDRMLSGEDIPERLKIGSQYRRRLKGGI